MAKYWFALSLFPSSPSCAHFTLCHQSLYPLPPFANTDFRLKISIKIFKVSILKYFSKNNITTFSYVYVIWNLVLSDLQYHLPVQLQHFTTRIVLSTQNCEQKKIHTFNQESFRKSVFEAEKQKTIFLTVQPYSGTRKPYILRTA